MRTEAAHFVGGGRTVAVVVIGAVAVVVLSACGLPGGGSARRIDDDAVPYGLLDTGDSAVGASSSAPVLPAHVPLVFWSDGDRLRPEAARLTCAGSSESLAERLLGLLADGPSDDTRASGRSSAIPPDSELDLVDLRDGRATVGIETDTPLSADRLPVAVGQIVLTIASVPAVRTVLLVSGGEPVQIPVPGGVLTEGPVMADDYRELLPHRFRDAGVLGCARP